MPELPALKMGQHNIRMRAQPCTHVLLVVLLRGGYQAYFFENINFEIAVAQQGPYMYQHFGEVSGPRRPTGSEPRPALIWAAPILGRGVARSRFGAKVPKFHQNVGTCMGLVGQLLSQN